MSFEFDTVYVFYGFAAVSAILFVEGIYLLFFSSSSYRSRINRRLQLMHNQPDREGILVQLRRERGLSSSGDFRLPVVWFNRLSRPAGDLRELKPARESVNALLQGFPGVP